jgi:hypothetical protein
MNKYDTLEYSQVKATTVSVRLRIYLFAFENANNDSMIAAAFTSHTLRSRHAATYEISCDHRKVVEACWPLFCS